MRSRYLLTGLLTPILLLVLQALVLSARTPIEATQRGPLLFIYNIEELPMHFTTDQGQVSALVSGQFLVRASQEASTTEAPAELISGMLYVGSVPTARGDSMPLRAS